MNGKKGMKEITVNELIALLKMYDGNLEVGFYLEGIGDFLFEGLYPATNMENGQPSLSMEFAWR